MGAEEARMIGGVAVRTFRSSFLNSFNCHVLWMSLFGESSLFRDGRGGGGLGVLSKALARLV
jgi:hypothetical protein